MFKKKQARVNVLNLPNEKVSKFLKEIVAVYKKYNLSLSHEDTQGSFIVNEYDEWDIEHLLNDSIIETKE